MLRFLKKPIVAALIIVIIGVSLGTIALLNKDKSPSYKFIIAKRSDLIQEVSVTGKVKSAQSVDLAFEKSGKISNVYVDVGDNVSTDQILASINNAELAAQLSQAESGVISAQAQLQQYYAALDTQKAKLAELKSGTRPEEIQAAQIKVANAERILKDAETNLENVKNKAGTDLQNKYSEALSSIQESVSVAKIALLTLTDIQSAHFTGNDQDSYDVADAKKIAVEALFDEKNAGRWRSDDISGLNSGIFGSVQDMSIDAPFENIDTALQKTINALQKVKLALEAIPITTSFTSTEKSNISSEKNNINAEITTAYGKQQEIAAQKALNANNISAAEANVTSAKNTLESAKADLALKKAGTVPEQITAQEANVNQAIANISSQKAKIKQAQANAANYRAQIQKTVIKAPVNGIITRQDAKIGEIVAANTPIISLISEAQFEIETNVPEADIAKIKVSDTAKVTLDAYGDDLIFWAKVVSIDPAETIIEGVPTYKVTLNFIEQNELIKSGMTANLDIATAKRENVIAVPLRSVITKKEGKFVRVVKNSGSGKKIIKEVAVKTGLRGSDGTIEITEGVEEGDKVISYMETK